MPSKMAAYDAALSRDIIKCRKMTFIGNLTAKRDITVTLEGGYDSGFMTKYGTMTTLKGMLTTTAGGGTLTIKNFILSE
jgi:hypothetical protein